MVPVYCTAGKDLATLCGPEPQDNMVSPGSIFTRPVVPFEDSWGAPYRFTGSKIDQAELFLLQT